MEQIDYKKIIGKRIKQRLIDLGINQDQLAEKIGMSKSGLSKIIIGINYPSIPVLISLKEVLGVTMDYFF